MPADRQIITNLTGDLRVSTSRFLQAMEEWSMSPASQYMWLVKFSSGNKLRSFPQALIDAGNGDTKYGVHAFENKSASIGASTNATSDKEWNLIKGNEYFNDSPNVNDSDMGCMVIHGVNIPGEQLGFGYAGPTERGGLIPVAHQNARLEPQELTMSVYEGNLSFVDTVIRPWIILTGHLGQVSRDIDHPGNIKCNITITQFAKTIGREVTEALAGSNTPGIPGVNRQTPDSQPSTLIVRKQFQFYNACPVRMESSDLTYGGDQGVMLRNVTWMYSHYSISNLQKNGVTAITVNDAIKKYVTSSTEPNAIGPYERKHSQLITTRWDQISEGYTADPNNPTHHENMRKRLDAMNRGVTRIDLSQDLKRQRLKNYTEIGNTDHKFIVDERLAYLGTKWTRAFLKHRENAGFTTKNGNVTYGKRSIKLYGPKHPNQHPEGYPEGATFETRWRDVKVTNLCGGVGGRPDICKPAPPPPGSALDRIRQGLRNLGKLARNARGFAAAFKRVGKAKGIKGKINALGDLNKSFGSLTGKTGKAQGSHKTLGGGMPKAGGYSKTGGALGSAGSVVSEAKKAARAITGGSRAKGGQ